MPRAAVNDLVEQYQRAFRMLYEEMERFDGAQWVKGISDFQAPAKVAMHIVDCLDYYFCGKPGERYHWGYRFGGGWWELPDDRLPDQGALLAYTREIEARIVSQFAAMDDADLSRQFEINDGSGATILGHAIYALRHTMHHHGELAALATYHGHEGGSWF